MEKLCIFTTVLLYAADPKFPLSETIVARQADSKLEMADIDNVSTFD